MKKKEIEEDKSDANSDEEFFSVKSRSKSKKKNVKDLPRVDLNEYEL